MKSQVKKMRNFEIVSEEVEEVKCQIVKDFQYDSECFKDAEALRYLSHFTSEINSHAPQNRYWVDLIQNCKAAR